MNLTVSLFSETAQTIAQFFLREATQHRLGREWRFVSMPGFDSYFG